MDEHNQQGRAELDHFISEGTSRNVYERYARLPSIAESTDFGELDENVVVLDTEATGFSFNHDELTQIAAARMHHGEIVEWFVTFVNPGKPIPEDVVHLTDIHDEDVVDAPLPDEALAQLAEFVGDAKVVAHNVDFDRTFTTKHPGGYPLLENVWIDSLDLARIAVPRLKSHRLFDLVRAFGAPLSTHRADADVAATCAIYRILLAGVAEMPPSLVCCIARLASVGEWSTQAVFEHFARVYEAAAEETLLSGGLRGSSGAGAEGGGSALGRCIDDERVSLEGPENSGGPGIPKGSGGLEGSRTPRGSEGSPRNRVTLEERAEGLGPLDLEFSLRSIRRERASRSINAKKKDAADIARDSSQRLVFPSREEITDAFSASGLVGGLYDNYEPRDEQREMALAVLDSFSSSKNLMVEAGTGVGKSMAYLVPSAMTAQENNITVGVATKTNALLDQLVYRELPALEQALFNEDPRHRRLTYAPLKGFSHYPCLLRIERLMEEGAQTRVVAGKEKSQAPALAALLSFVEQSEYDDIDGLKIDYRLVPRRTITTSSRDCLRRKCPYYGSMCFVHGSRTRAESADIVVTNHSLLFCDLVADGGLLPPVRYWTIDEAHGAEAEARRAFSIGISAEDVLGVANRVDGANAANNVFARVERKVVGKVVKAGAAVPSGKGDSRKGNIIASGIAGNDAGAAVTARAEGLASSGERDVSRETSAGDGPAGELAGVGPEGCGAERGADAVYGNAGAAGVVPLQDGLTLFYALTDKARQAGVEYGAAAREFASSLKDLLFFDPNKRNKSYETVEVWINDDVRGSYTFGNVSQLGKAMAQKAEKLVFACQELVGFLDDIEGAEQAQRDVAVVASELKEQINAVDIILENPREEYAYSATLNRKKDRVAEKLEALPINVGARLNETLFCRTHSVVFASATLTVDNRFDPFEDALGLNMSGYSAGTTRQLPSSYDFDRQMIIYVVSDMPEPTDSRYLAALQRLLVEVHLAQGGSMLTLFTNRRDMERCFEEVQPRLKADDLRLVCQKWGVSVKGLRDDFLKDEHLSLFALKSFWEGFDAPGSTLKGVVIPKLPFSKPTDPLSCERAARDDQAWRRYVLPAAVLETKQAAGRLIRKADDSGVLILADKRLISKGYGKTFLNSLPSRTIRVMPTAQIAAELAAARTERERAARESDAGGASEQVGRKCDARDARGVGEARGVDGARGADGRAAR